MVTAVGSQTAQAAALAVRAGQPGAVTTMAAALVVYSPPGTKNGRSTQAAALVVRSGVGNVKSRTTQTALLAVYATGIPQQSRSRVWTFTLDGHSFYVLNLGAQGTFVYDATTQQWCQFDTEGYGQWNMIYGTMWGQSRIVAGDSINEYTWELDPTAVFDEGWRDIYHTVTGALQTRSRVFMAVDAVRLSASVGQVDDAAGASISLIFSDDNGQTWSTPQTITLTQGDYSGELAWRSLGSFMAPGRIFEFTDIGGLIRIDGADVFINNFDDTTPDQNKAGS